MEVSAKDVERVAEGIGQEVEGWASREREEVLRQEESGLPEQTIAVLYICFDGTGVPMTQAELVGRKGK